MENNNKASNAQKELITYLCNELCYEPEDYLPEGLTVSKASKTIGELRKELG